MIFIASFSCKVESIRNLAPIYTKLEKLPTHIRRVGPYFRIDKTSGSFKGHTLYISEDERRDGIHDYLIERYQAFAGVPSFVHVIEEWMTMEETIKVVQGAHAEK